ncbi:ubiquinone biosynthesis regulatory protein kinase UbiB [Acidithiobacillus sp. 'AMD consortium']|jgi:ubiquinone biosynthesis protein|uniref:Ubiquinone biosynthesis regulatory protein kinase UbiB n=2 Tax=Acidithiobacillus ferridurans TaxID=1232575 RepID=A0A8X8G6T5_ACIFI|nr:MULTISPECIES: ubiquinone biosynthesis regulatory protein kinase UbiB [Acidithiobacillus]MBU2715394.1 ubiquinone biosynthesis regulatory protein kinase UbiB [Acidithiobacillus ferridurans]MBU2723125.1 ubiquinone biosynthesis regulatory protein kinase UbiB [Acidithiobacillus ferridurans]MBU2726231.1 ubiquinone biosynthesis regulatory protein kinase UbiB [Acidithiobacillus ferridurans]MBU2806669.1 ubiquinone biosynthesis regulatory protein kinase UbiB [Acidithiobacillus ferridurans]QFG77519.1 
MRQSFLRFVRTLQITRVLVRYRLDEVLYFLPLLKPYQAVLRLNPMTWLAPRPQGSFAERLREALETLGPTFIKLGQMLSTRRDLLPDHITHELAKLQDAVPPFPSNVARQIIEAALGKTLDAIFSRFDDQPAAAASIAQVHFGQLLDGREVAIKVRRPGLQWIIEQDLAILALLADLAERYSQEGRRLRVRAVVAEYAKVIRGELDLLREAANASQLRRNFTAEPELLYVPEIYWDYCASPVLVMERIYGIPIGQREALHDAGIDFDQLSRRAAEIFFRQVFRDAYFHADMHPGNIFIDPKNGRFIAVDFGIMGSLDDASQHYLAENMVAFFRRDYRRVAEAHVEAGWVPADTNVQDFETAIRAIAEPVFEKPLNEISVASLLLRLFQTTRAFHMQTQPQLLLLQKTLVNVEGIARDFNPALNIWEVATPLLTEWLSRQRGPQGWWSELKRYFPQWGLVLPEIPVLLHNILRQTQQGELPLVIRSNDIQGIRQELHNGLQKLTYSVGGTFIVVGLGIIAALEHRLDSPVLHLPVWAWLIILPMALWAGTRWVRSIFVRRD